MPQTGNNATEIPTGPFPTKARASTTQNKQMVIPIVLIYNKGFLPILSMRKRVINIKAVFVTPTATVAARSCELSSIPAALNMAGL